MEREIIGILSEIKGRVTDDSDVVWTKYTTVDELRNHIDACIARLRQGDKNVLSEINIDFAPTSTYQELSIQNGWSDDYIRLSNQFDKIYEPYK